ncbi:MAG: cysteine desulfurase [Candidatus Woesearchaeota archaeon]|nr:cysteine desulfurase [Candidatus Woesearchaeota archaeon]
MFRLNPEKIRKDFPVLKKQIYFDNACMSLKPVQVMNKMNEYYSEYTACAGRSIHSWSRKVEEEVVKARKQVAHLINSHENEIVFTRNTTEGINLVANSFSSKDEVVISDKEHNSNLIPWLKKKAKLIVVPTNSDGTFNLDAYEKAITKNTRLVSITHTSNIDGVENPIKEIAQIAHNNGAVCLIDGAQGVPSKQVDVRKLGIDLLAFSGHKMLGPTGTGVLFGKKEVLKKLDQFIVGGETVKDSNYTSYTPDDVPMKFEAGLQDYAGILGLGEACKYLEQVGLNKIENHELKLNKIISEGLESEEKITVLGPEVQKRSGIFSFMLKGIDMHHIAKMLDTQQIMVRSGVHCCHSWFNNRKLAGSVRASVYIYNTEEEAHTFVQEMKKITRL